jgi:hypothetical protein
LRFGASAFAETAFVFGTGAALLGILQAFQAIFQIVEKAHLFIYTGTSDMMPNEARLNLKKQRVKDPRLKSLRDGLLRLHKYLLDSERAAYERDVAPITSTGQYLDLVLSDPWFAWLRELSQFVVVIDETLDLDEPPTAEDAARLVAQARALISPAEQGVGFARRYYDAMQRDPGVVLAHSDMMKVFADLG